MVLIANYSINDNGSCKDIKMENEAWTDNTDIDGESV